MGDNTGDIEFGEVSDSDATSSSGGAGGVSNGNGSRNSYHDTIYIDGEYGKTLRRRDEDADVGNRKLGMIAAFSGTVEYDGDEYSGLVKVGVDETEGFMAKMWDSGINFRVYNFQK